ncbi:hypothetical protein PP459_gp092 [Streptomyces phage Wakanda]|uniref:Uncharacterized protein n=2 Tax=Wakandavirus TaxID=3044854 RepID=A0A6G8R3F8_9CAUD|nr:hypothetical protein PP459_gp092 [Streptomyces phage Wakanda]YP_010652462.1 hypothetical protein PP460_gp096 [Streptomyces phage Muntaha]QIN94141.1 hypothetical protein SEA_WAKANDA_180 [Streptomyces phage Wakanda]QIN94706.1 hypothetical protein SEA_MUNTAHA_182 [Streptomyces phage Muntaha]
MNYEEIIEGYNSLREKCLELAKKNPALFGEDAWLRGAIQEEDITLDFIEGVGVECHGLAYTTQTMDHEVFCFVIPFSELD